MDFKDLRFFVAVYEERGFSAAAKRLDTVQSNVSARVRKLETEFGRPLFKRLWRGVTPTPLGSKLYRFARRLLARVQKLETLFERRAARAGARSRPRGPRRHRRSVK